MGRGGTGKWSKPGVPHRGWTCLTVKDLGTTGFLCEMCEEREIRYVHFMTHSDYLKTLAVGRICAAIMEEDSRAGILREKCLRNEAARRKRWLAKSWKVHSPGNSSVRSRGHLIVVFGADDAW